MKIQTAKQLLYNAAIRIQACLSEKKLAHVGLKTYGEDTLTLMASDWLLSVYHHVSCEISEHGESFVPAVLFVNVVRELPEGTIQLEKKDNALVITATSSEFYFKLPLIEDGHWSQPFELDGEAQVKFAPTELSYMVEQVVPSIVAESPRPYGSVGYFHKTGADCLRLVGSDGYKLSYCEIPIADRHFPDNICLSRRGLHELVRVCADDTEEVRIFVIRNNTVLAAKTRQSLVFIRLSAVDYPDYLDVLPKSKLSTSKVERAALQTAIKRVLLATDNTRSIRMNFSRNKLLLQARNSNSSECQEALVVDNTLKGDHELNMNGKFILDILATVVSDTVIVSFQDADQPFVIVPEIEVAGLSFSTRNSTDHGE